MSYLTEILADSPHWWFRLNETDSTAGSAGLADYVRSTYKLTRYGGCSQVGSLLASEPGGYATNFSGSDVIFPEFGPGPGDFITNGYLSAYSAGTTAWAYSAGDSITMEVWVKASDTTLSGMIYQAVSAQMMLQAGTGFQSVLMLGSSNYVTRTTTGIFTDTTTAHHLVVTWDNATRTRKHYVDGSLRDTWTEATGSSLYLKTSDAAGLSYQLFFGMGSDGNNIWSGTIDEPAFYRSVLSATRIAAHYNAGIDTFASVRRRVSVSFS